MNSNSFEALKPVLSQVAFNLAAKATAEKYAAHEATAKGFGEKLYNRLYDAETQARLEAAPAGDYRDAKVLFFRITTENGTFDATLPINTEKRFRAAQLNGEPMFVLEKDDEIVAEMEAHRQHGNELAEERAKLTEEFKQKFQEANSWDELVNLLKVSE